MDRFKYIEMLEKFKPTKSQETIFLKKDKGGDNSLDADMDILSNSISADIGVKIIDKIGYITENQKTDSFVSVRDYFNKNVEIVEISEDGQNWTNASKASEQENNALDMVMDTVESCQEVEFQNGSERNENELGKVDDGVTNIPRLCNNIEIQLTNVDGNCYEKEIIVLEKVSSNCKQSSIENVSLDGSVSSLHGRRMGIIPEESNESDEEMQESPCLIYGNQEEVERRLSFLMKRKLSAELRGSDDDLSKLKLITSKLNLETRRPSFLQWRAEHLGKPLLAKLKPGKALDDIRNEQTLGDRTEEIGLALKWLRKELLEMRESDQQLARQLVALRHEIHQLKLQQSCHRYEEMIDDEQYEMEENDEISDVTDLPLHMRKIYHTSLRHLGVTPMNITSRRFSLR